MHQAIAASAVSSDAGGAEAGDAVMARWLQSAGLQHLASPVAASADQRMLPNLLLQVYGAQSAEEKQKFFKLLRNLNLSGESGSEQYTPTSQSFGAIGAADGFYSPDLRGEFGAGLLDLHSVDDTGLLSEEMNLLAEVDHPGSLMDNYISHLNFVLSRKAAGLVSLQARMARFQHRLKEQEILGRKKAPR